MKKPIQNKTQIAEAAIQKAADDLAEGIASRALDMFARVTGSAKMHQRANNRLAYEDMMKRWKMVTVRDRSKSLPATVKDFITSTYGNDMAQKFSDLVTSASQDPNVEIPYGNLARIFKELTRHGLRTGVIKIKGETRPDEPGTLSPIGGPKQQQQNRYYGGGYDNDRSRNAGAASKPVQKTNFVDDLINEIDHTFASEEEKNAFRELVAGARSPDDILKNIKNNNIKTVPASVLAAALRAAAK